MSRSVRFVPLLVLVAVLGALLWRLANPADTVIRSKLAGRPVPQFVLPGAVPGEPQFTSASLASGSPRLLNIFASWCVPCIAEAPVLEELKRRGVKIDAIAVRDRPGDVGIFLGRHGDPFDRIGSDVDSKVQLALGSSGVPESFVIDGKGVIRFQHIGPIEPGQIEMILAELEKAR